MSAEHDRRLLLLSDKDNVLIAMRPINRGERIRIDGNEIEMTQPSPAANKIAIKPIATGDKVYKYGSPIGSATRDIQVGELVHTHNLKSDYIPIVTYSDHQPTGATA